jgi:23S rRNA (uracil1939-C5)-methyltransferase
MSRRRRNRKQLPEGLVRVDIESFCHDGRGVTHVDGKATFVDGALPGEVVDIEFTDMKRDFAEARVAEVYERSSFRTEPKCDYFGLCGGCSFQHVDPERQIEVKQDLLAEQFRRIGRLDEVPLWDPLRGPVWGYRHKARLSVKYVEKKQKVLVGFREKRSRLLADMGHCEVLHPRVGRKLVDMAQLINCLSIRTQIPQIEVAMGDTGCILVFRNLADPSAEDLERMTEFGRVNDFRVYLQPKGLDSVVALGEYERDLLSYSVPAHDIRFEFGPLQFIQVNPEMNRSMIDRAIDLLAPEADDCVIDLFCGIGNFTLPIARYAERVVGVEGSRELVAQAERNAALNQLDNASFHVADLTSDQGHQPWYRETYSLALVDPSRAGAEEILACFPRWGVKRIVYVSCNPSTLARDASILVERFGYCLKGAGVMDMFPQTSHVESIALFEKD